MLAIALSLLFGIVAFTAIAQTVIAIRVGASRSRMIVAELATLESAARRPVKVATAPRPRRQPRFAAA